MTLLEVLHLLDDGDKIQICDNSFDDYATFPINSYILKLFYELKVIKLFAIEKNTFRVLLDISIKRR